MSAPNGTLYKDLIIWGDPPRWVARGFFVQMPDRSSSSDSYLKSLTNALRSILQQLGRQYRMQIQWKVDSNYAKELNAYAEETLRLCEPGSWPYQERMTVAKRYWDALREGRLRREHLRIYISRAIPKGPPMLAGEKGVQQHYKKLYAELFNELNLWKITLESALAAFGVTVQPMTDEEHFVELFEFLNPSKIDVMNPEEWKTDLVKQYRPEDSIQENCLQVGLKGIHERELCAFEQDGLCHGILTLNRLPDNTSEQTMLMLTRTDELDYCITMNLYPANKKKVIAIEQNQIDRLKAAYADDGHQEHKDAIEMKEKKIQALNTGSVTPFDADVILRCWAPSSSELQLKLKRLQSIYNRMDGARYHEPQTFETNRRLWAQTWPGWIYGDCTAHAIYMEDIEIAHMAPLSSTFTGYLDDAEAILEGTNGALVGYKTFVNEQPQHAMLFGATGCGKSVFQFNLLTQTIPYFAYTVLIEEGNSYRAFIKKMGGQSLEIHPNCNLCLNYFDTFGAPLNHLQLENAASLAARMAGVPSEDDKAQLREALISAYINQVYQEHFEDWARNNPQKELEIAKLTVVMEQLLHELPGNPDILDVWQLMRDFATVPQIALDARLQRVTAQQVTQAIQGDRIRSVAYAFMSAADMPTHAQLVATMENPREEHDPHVVKDLAALLKSWTAADGRHGKLFDGISNVALNKAINHIELAGLSDESPMKPVVVFLITNAIRQIILSMPRHLRKQVVFEEVARWLGVRGGTRAVEETYAQTRKYGCRALSIVQQYAQFKESASKRVIIGNSSQFILGRQKDAADLEDICRSIDLPEPARAAIMQYPIPAHIKNEYSQFTLFATDGLLPICGTITNRISPAMREAIEADKQYEGVDRFLRKVA